MRNSRQAETEAAVFCGFLDAYPTLRRGASASNWSMVIFQISSSLLLTAGPWLVVKTMKRAPIEVPEETEVPFYEKGKVRIRYEIAGSGFPLLVTPGGGLNSRVSNWPTAVFNAMEAFKDDLCCITMDQRNANG